MNGRSPNQLLASLPVVGFELLRPHLRSVELKHKGYLGQDGRVAEGYLLSSSTSMISMCPLLHRMRSACWSVPATIETLLRSTASIWARNSWVSSKFEGPVSCYPVCLWVGGSNTALPSIQQTGAQPWWMVRRLAYSSTAPGQSLKVTMYGASAALP